MSAAIEIRYQFEQLDSMPSLPVVARRLLDLRNNPDANSADLAETIQIDPAITAQIMRFTQTPMYSAHRHNNSIKDTVHLIGFQKALNLSLGLAAGQAFKISAEGPIGLASYWYHSIFCAQLMQTIAEKQSLKLDIDPGLAYLSGLLHHMGYLILGHLFPIAYDRLNKTLHHSPSNDIMLCEQRQLGIHHTDIGVRVMREWSLPAAITTCTFEHHNENYRGNYWQYANLALVADRLLSQHRVGCDAPNIAIPESLLERLDIDLATLETCLDRVLDQRASLETFIAGIK